MFIDIILISVGLTGLLIASFIDLKKREVPDWLNFSLIASGLGIRLIYSLTTLKFSFFIYGVVALIIMFTIGAIMYYTKQWGGGDTKLISALGVIFATGPITTKVPYFIILFFNILIIGALYGIAWSIFLAIKNKKNFIKEMQKLLPKSKFQTILSIIFGIILITGSLLFIETKLKLMLIFLGSFTIIFPYLLTSIRAVENVCMYKKIQISKLTEGDWIANKKLASKFKIPELGIERKQINLLKKAKIKTITIKQGIAFVPSFLLGTLTTLLLGNLFSLIL